MHFDFMDAVAEQAEKEGLQSSDQLSLIAAGRYWLILGSGATLILALTMACYGPSHSGLVVPLSMEELHLHAANLKNALFQAIVMPLERTALLADTELLGDTLTWAALVIFLGAGTVVMRFDFIDAVKEEEAVKEGMHSMEDSCLILGGRCWLILGGGVALFLALTVAWWQESTQCGLVAPLFMDELSMHATNLKDSLLMAIAMLFLGDAPTWSALVVFLMFGAVAMRFDFIDAVHEEAVKEGLQSEDEFSLIPVGRCWLILGCGMALALRWHIVRHISGQVSEEVAIFFLSAVLVIGLATTISDSPKSSISRAFTAPLRIK